MIDLDHAVCIGFDRGMTSIDPVNIDHLTRNALTISEEGKRPPLFPCGDEFERLASGTHSGVPTGFALGYTQKQFGVFGIAAHHCWRTRKRCERSPHNRIGTNLIKIRIDVLRSDFT